jgi:hypothetical protein
MERLILEDYLIDLMYHFNDNHKECIKQIQTLPFSFNLDYLIIEVIIVKLHLTQQGYLLGVAKTAQLFFQRNLLHMSYNRYLQNATFRCPSCTNILSM